MKSKLLKLSQMLQDLNNPEEAESIRGFIDQPEPEAEKDIEYPLDETPNVIRDYSRPTTIEDYPTEAESPKTTSLSTIEILPFRPI